VYIYSLKPCLSNSKKCHSIITSVSIDTCPPFTTVGGIPGCNEKTSREFNLTHETISQKWRLTFQMKVNAFANEKHIIVRLIKNIVRQLQLNMTMEKLLPVRIQRTLTVLS